MTHKNAVLEFLKDSNGAFCDDCISKRKNILPRQTVYQICSSLADKGYISRSNGLCSGCGKDKKVSRIADDDIPGVPYNKSDVIAHKEAPCINSKTSDLLRKRLSALSGRTVAIEGTLFLKASPPCIF